MPEPFSTYLKISLPGTSRIFRIAFRMMMKKSSIRIFLTVLYLLVIFVNGLEPSKSFYIVLSIPIIVDNIMKNTSHMPAKPLPKCNRGNSTCLGQICTKLLQQYEGKLNVHMD